MVRRSRKKLGPRARAVIDTMLPSGAAHRMLPGAFEAGFDDFYDEFARTAVAPMRLAFGTALFAAIWVAPILIRRLPPLTRHSRADRERALGALATSGSPLLRQLATVLKGVICLGYGADPAVRRAIGYR
ncbi:MAG TPA: hypothetical protein VFW12_02745 [Candidatus Limnocylindria bacterium]|nr:hypothetical protein [Candidatus Limnocylindria bacterium]